MFRGAQFGNLWYKVSSSYLIENKLLSHSDDHPVPGVYGGNCSLFRETYETHKQTRLKKIQRFVYVKRVVSQWFRVLKCREISSVLRRFVFNCRYPIEMRQLCSEAAGTEWYLIIAVCVKILAAVFVFRIPSILDRMDCS